MQLHQLQSGGHKKGQRIGRGGKRGSYSGRGVKGQKSRAGRRIRPAERDLIIRLPKRRGFANKPKSQKATVFNLDDLALKLKTYDNSSKAPTILNISFLKQVELLPMKFRGEVKILGDGEIKTAVAVEGLKVSKSAKTKIEKAGGRVIANNANLGN
ncbi:MAG: uL15 family ribosomal protein [bacterium]|nr:uL15 family ribosomal protein [bacterium]